MKKYGINVPDGIPAKTVDEVQKAAQQLADEKGEVLGTSAEFACTCWAGSCCRLE
jgi:hypothetical protein